MLTVKGRERCKGGEKEKRRHREVQWAPTQDWVGSCWDADWFWCLISSLALISALSACFLSSLVVAGTHFPFCRVRGMAAHPSTQLVPASLLTF